MTLGATSLPPRIRGRRPVLLWMAALALLLQSFLTQTHVHLPSGALPPSTRVDRIATASISVERPSTGHSSCPLCIELKLAGHYLAPSPFVLTGPSLVAFWFGPAALVEAVRPRPTHHWQSRAPPHRPQF